MTDKAEILALLDKYAPPPAKAKIGLTREQVRAAINRTLPPKPVEPMKPEEVRRAMAKHARRLVRGHCGRKGLPPHVVATLYGEYRAGKSCDEIAAIYGGTRQSIWEIFQCRGLELRKRDPQPRIEHGGRSYSMHKGYYRATERDRKPLHHVLWEEVNGPIPEGWQVTFRDANPSNIALENLLGAPIADVTRFHRARHLAKKEAA